MVPRVADMATVHLYDEHGALHRVALAHRDPESEAAMLAYTAGQGSEIHNLPLDTATLGGRTIRSGAPAVIERVAMDNDHARLLETLHITSSITAPLIGRGETLGVLNFMRVAESPPYRTDDQTLAEELARRAAVAIDNARLHANRTEVARLLQASLLPPRLPEVPHVDLAAAYHPAGQGVEAGGDFYDLFPLPGGRWALMIGDVCGTGPAAAALTAQVRHTARAIAGTGADASAVVATVNDTLAASIDEEKFCTMVMAVVTSVGADGVELDLVCAGHPCPLVLRAGGKIDDISAAGGLVGVFAGARHSSSRVRLEPGDTLVLYTDGVTEARSASPGPDGTRGFFETEHLAALVSALAGQPSSVMVSAIEDNLMAFAGGRLVDDVAILALRASPLS
jgi:serine phosphatase RsbU (regulator of sigma subunit)